MSLIKKKLNSHLRADDIRKRVLKKNISKMFLSEAAVIYEFKEIVFFVVQIIEMHNKNGSSTSVMHEFMEFANVENLVTIRTSTVNNLSIASELLPLKLENFKQLKIDHSSHAAAATHARIIDFIENIGNSLGWALPSPPAVQSPPPLPTPPSVSSPSLVPDSIDSSRSEIESSSLSSSTLSIVSFNEYPSV